MFLRKQTTHCLLLTQTLFHQGFFSLRNSTGLSAVWFTHTHTHHLKLISNLIIPLLYWACWSPSGQHHSHFSPVGNTTSSGAHTHTYTPTIFQHLHKYTRCKVAKAKTNTLNLFLKAWPQQTRTHIYKHTVSPQCFTFTFHSITTHAMEKNTHGE